MATEVKVCGFVEPEGALAAAELGARYLGLNFYRQSPRCVALERAREIADAARERFGAEVELVGVFVDATRREIEEAIERVGLDRVQMSGDEAPDDFLPFAPRGLKAFRSGAIPSPEALARYGTPWGVLVDAPHATLFGGTGEAWDYSLLSGWASGPRAWKLFLAGGLSPENVQGAVRALRPDAVDVCSAVESAPGIKDRERMERFFEEVKLGSISAPA
jgi:phosphoribosylanthranilate isomerase